jgi:hypothetical protein
VIVGHPQQTKKKRHGAAVSSRSIDQVEARRRRTKMGVVNGVRGSQ